MSQVLLPILFALFLWWFSTGLILLADRLRVSGRTMLLAASVLAVLAFAGLWNLRDTVTVAGAYGGFVAGLVLWGWHEVSFLSGLVTGPRRTDCPPEAHGWQRFGYAAQTLIHHEIAIALTALALWAMLAGAANQIGLWTFGILWAMRLSTKFNIFLGVPNITEEFLPARLAHLKTYFRTRALNLLFPFSVTAASGLVFWLTHLAIHGADSFTVTGFTLLTTLAALGVIEHWFLVLPLRDEELWRWYLGGKSRAAAPTTSAETAARTSKLATLSAKAEPCIGPSISHQSHEGGLVGLPEAYGGHRP